MQQKLPQTTSQAKFLSTKYNQLKPIIAQTSLPIVCSAYYLSFSRLKNLIRKNKYMLQHHLRFSISTKEALDQERNSIRDKTHLQIRKSCHSLDFLIATASIQWHLEEQIQEKLSNSSVQQNTFQQLLMRCHRNYQGCKA